MARPGLIDLRGVYPPNEMAKHGFESSGQANMTHERAAKLSFRATGWSFA